MKAGWSLLAGLMLAATAAGGADLTAGWQALTNYRSEEALKIFDRSLNAPDPAEARAARFGRAVALLDRQPVSAGQIDEARGIFRALAGSGVDDPAQGARFFLGRIAQHHQQQPDGAEAARQYRQLIAEHENSIWAQTALSRLALLQIYELDPQLPPAARIARAEKLLAYARTPSAESEIHLVVANAMFFYRLPAAGALPHLLAVERLGRVEWTVRSEVLVQIAELSRLAGEKAQAVRYYRMFLKENPRDPRGYIIRERIAGLEKPAG
jgi:tetratricopeptide (TPR) repeat protein